MAAWLLAFSYWLLALSLFVSLRSKPLELVDDLQDGTLLVRATRRASRPRRLILKPALLQTAWVVDDLQLASDPGDSQALTDKGLKPRVEPMAKSGFFTLILAKNTKSYN